ncbi:hypothetical protein M0812_20029 [Anaeramoeba flamelloides]|uniref:DUF7948 domain-containing protein n=1 Tax=Anaeramoeba flamelloides TaxID=1746091 RepID=A0AAV7YYX9_9EUKA|nr:hypothetical protein M0812_20029 [Anaeramoeba flamelloides]
MKVLFLILLQVLFLIFVNTTQIERSTIESHFSQLLTKDALSHVSTFASSKSETKELLENLQNFEQTQKHYFNKITVPTHFIENYNPNLYNKKIKYLGKTFNQGTWYFSNQSIIYSIDRYTINMKIPNANLSNLRALNKLKSKTHYFHGSNKTNWKTDLANYAMIQYSNIFEGVDLQFETTTTQTQTQKKQGFDANLQGETKIKSSFYLSQAKALSKIQWQFQTSNNLEIRIPKDKGTLQFVSKLTKEIILEESKPIFFQNNLELQGQFILKNHQEKKEHQVQHDRENTVSFLINDPNFQPNNHLIIDPTYSTFFAGDYTDEIQDFVLIPKEILLGLVC